MSRLWRLGKSQKHYQLGSVASLWKYFYLHNITTYKIHSLTALTDSFLIDSLMFTQSHREYNFPILYMASHLNQYYGLTIHHYIKIKNKSETGRSETDGLGIKTDFF